MARFLHKFNTNDEFLSAYTGESYIEPWVSHTVDVNRVNYNKVHGPTIEVGSYYHDDEWHVLWSVHANNGEMSCEDLFHWSRMSNYYLQGNAELKIQIIDLNGNIIYGPDDDQYFGSVPYNSSFSTASTECEVSDYYMNYFIEHPISGQPTPSFDYVYDTTTGTFHPDLDGCTIRCCWLLSK